MDLSIKHESRDGESDKSESAALFENPLLDEVVIKEEPNEVLSETYPVDGQRFVENSFHVQPFPVAIYRNSSDEVGETDFYQSRLERPDTASTLDRPETKNTNIELGGTCRRCSTSPCICSVNIALFMADASPEKPYRCPQCPFETKWKNSLIMHERGHTGEKPFMCSFCPYTSAQKVHVTQHEKNHLGEKPYKCRYCAYETAWRSNLRLHERTHTGEKPFKCSHCSYCCSSTADKKRHERTHTGEKLFRCSLCPYSFVQKGNLKRHIRTHTGEKPYNCSSCSKAYSTKSDLKTHERLHSAEANSSTVEKSESESGPSVSDGKEINMTSIIYDHEKQTCEADANVTE